jgi:hypothetical protein
VASGDRHWMNRASCLNHPDLDWFDLDCYLYACLEVCATCPVADECLDYAVRHDIREGLWGGEWGYRLADQVTGRGRRGRHGAG